MSGELVALPFFEIGGAHANRSENFESFCCDLAIAVEGLPRSTVPYGRSGQSQGGIDAKERTPLGERLGLQAKLVKPPTTSKAKVSQFQRWVGEYAEHHTDHELGRLILCAPWPNDRAIVEEILRYNDDQGSPFHVEHWNAEILNKFAASYPGVVRRYFGPEWSADVAARDAQQRAAALRLGIDRYLHVESARSTAKDESAPVDDRLRAWRELARAYREGGYVGLARDAELKHVLLGIDEKHGGRRNDALRMAASAVDDLQPRRAWVIDLHLERAGSGNLGAIRLVSNALEDPDASNIEAAVLAVVAPEATLDRGALVALGLLVGELAIGFHHIAAARKIAEHLHPLLPETDGTFAYARLAALLGDVQLRDVELTIDLERTTTEGRILLHAREGRRAVAAGRGQVAVQHYSEAEVEAAECGLEGPARSARQTISRVREWLPFRTEHTTSFFELHEADRLLYWSLTREFGDYPDPARAAGLTALEVLQTPRDNTPTDSHVELVGALVLAVRGGFLADEIACHRALAGLAERQDDLASACWHATWGADEKRARATSGESTDLDRLLEPLRSPIPSIAVAACRAVAGSGWFASDDQAHQLRDALHTEAPWRTGMGPSLGEARVQALSALGAVRYADADWLRDVELFEQCAPVFQAGQPMTELAALGSWLIRWSPEADQRNRVVDALIAASQGDGDGPHFERRKDYENPILQLCEERPEDKDRLCQLWLEATGFDLYGDETLHTASHQSDLDYLRNLSPNDNPGIRSGYQVRSIAFVNVRAWTPNECGEALRSLLGLATSSLDSAMTRRSALRSIGGLAPHSCATADDRQSISTDLLDLARREMDIPAAHPFFDSDPLLWAEALRAAASLTPQPPGAELMDRLYGLLTGEDQRGQSVAVDIVRDLGVENAPVPIPLLTTHPSWIVREGAVRIASQPDRLDQHALQAAATDTDWRVRRRLAASLADVGRSDPSFASKLGVQLQGDRNALVRWFAAGPTSLES